MKVYLPFLIAIIFASCNGDSLYKAGNLIELGYPIETSLRSSLIRNYLDTLIQKRGYNIPDKWSHLNKLVDIDSTFHKRIYFKKNPEEMYLISFGGMLVLSDIYNPQINQTDWVAERAAMPKEEELRVKARFKKEILDIIEVMANQDGLADSLIYKQ